MTGRNFLIICGALLISSGLFAQQTPLTQRSLDIDFAFAKSQASVSALGSYDWRFGKNKKLFAGVGGRLSLYTGRNQYYATAPAKLTSGERGPQVFFIPNIVENMDSLFVQRPTVFSVNASINLGYRFNDKLQAGFNIDAIGFSAGKKVEGIYINGDERISSMASVSHLNALLVSDNDLGSLNSELYAKYRVSDRWGLKAGLQFLFTEYKTTYDVQQSPEPNNRFRRKSLMVMVGVSF